MVVAAVGGSVSVLFLLWSPVFRTASIDALDAVREMSTG
jgi:hypothetical protein